MPAFGQHALVDDEFQLTTDERVRLGLEQPNHPAALSQGRIKNISGNRIRYAMAELAAMNVENVHEWLAILAKDSPKAAIDAFIELAKFSAPQLKAVAIDVRSGDGSVKHMSTAELERELGSVVSDQ